VEIRRLEIGVWIMGYGIEIRVLGSREIGIRVFETN